LGTDDLSIGSETNAEAVGETATSKVVDTRRSHRAPHVGIHIIIILAARSKNLLPLVPVYIALEIYDQKGRQSIFYGGERVSAIDSFDKEESKEHQQNEKERR
jgi:hypothetical protein